MKKPERSFVVEIDQKAHLGVSPESVISISLINSRTGKDTMTYSASVEKVHATLARWHAKEHPTGKRRRRLLTSSEEMRRYRKEHPD
jgi:hypothetical protein